MKYQRGFTLNELLVSTVIFGIIACLSVPAFQHLIAKQQASAFASLFYHHLNYARTEAISKSVNVSLCASANTIECTKSKDWSKKIILIFTDNNGDGHIDTNDTILRRFKHDVENGTLTWSSFGNLTYLQWKSGGSTYFQNGNFTYCPPDKNPENAKKLILNAAGRIYFGRDTDNDGIQEGADGVNITCT